MFDNKSIPAIQYDREELWEMIVEIPVGKEQQQQLGGYLDAIERQISIIQESQSFETVQQALTEIHNNIDKMYNATKSYDLPFSNTVRELLLKWMAPVKSVLGKQEPQSSRGELELKTKLLYAEQSYIVRQSHLHEALRNHLKQLKQLLNDNLGQAAHRCYIVYAPPSGDSKTEEYWVPPFLSLLYEHLTEAGIRVLMDSKDLQPGENLNRFITQYNEGNDIILIGTESLNYCHLSVTYYSIKTALAIIFNHLKSRKNIIYPLLISGTVETSLPKEFDFNVPTANGYDGYIATLHGLISWLLKYRIVHKQPQYDQLWVEYNKNSQKIPANLASVNAEIALGYHQGMLGLIRSDIQYLSVQAQGIQSYGQEISAKVIQHLDESLGSLQQCFDSFGQQFQRPRRNPDYVKRPLLSDKMIQHFTKAGKPVLVLTGLRGIGKTALAEDYYLNPHQPYKLRCWFQVGNNDKSLVDQYGALAISNGIDLPINCPKEQKVLLVKEWLEQQQDCLLIYDEVSDTQALEQFLPRTVKHQIIITTNNRMAWRDENQYSVLEVPIMEEQEAISLIYTLTALPVEYSGPHK